jgi:tRNA G18 (ribose-2'-O)-methylase SpoU
MLIPITSIDAPELAPYCDLRHRNPTRHARQFIAEGDKLVERLLASHYRTESIFAAEDYVEKLLPRVPEDVPVYVAPRKLLEETIGFNFHRGCLACGVREPVKSLEKWQRPTKTEWLIVACPDVQDPTNLGTLLRNCAAFGVDLVLLGGKCADPFSRRVLRVSMGAVLELEIVEAQHLDGDLDLLKREQGVELVATVLDASAVPLDQAFRSPRMAILFGSEGHGLETDWIERADRRVTIPMQLGTDSLNVAVASGIFLYHFSRRNVDSHR